MEDALSKLATFAPAPHLQGTRQRVTLRSLQILEAQGRQHRALARVCLWTHAADACSAADAVSEGAVRVALSRTSAVGPRGARTPRSLRSCCGGSGATLWGRNGAELQGHPLARALRSLARVRVALLLCVAKSARSERAPRRGG